MALSIHKEKIKRFYDDLGEDRERWRQRNRYYHEHMLRYLAFLIPEGKKVIVLGSGNGYVLERLKPAFGVGIDISGRMTELARRRCPQYTFIEGDIEDPSSWGIDGVFDFIVMPSCIGYLEDIQAAFEQLHPFCRDDTRIVVCSYNFLWEPVLRLAERLKMKMPKADQNWLSPWDIENLLFLSDFEVVKTDRRLIVPRKIPLVYKLFEIIGVLPFFNVLSLNQFIVARPVPKRRVKEKTVTIVIPCRNEEGNIESAIRRMPQFGKHQEILFVEGGSEDNTITAIRRVIHMHPERDIKVFVQPGKGKADAVRTGFEHASGELLTVLDGDLTAPPEDLPKFYNACAAGKGEFINGSRMVYPMEDQAMRTLNRIANKFFSLMFSWILNQRIRDTLCGAKMISRRHYEQLKERKANFRDLDPFGDFDLLFGASMMNLKIVEIPIRYRERVYGDTNIRRFRHGWLLLKMTWHALVRIKQA